MAAIADRVMETTITTGKGPVTTNGAVAQYQSFASAFTNGATFPYCLLSGDGTNWETGTGIISISGGTTTIQRSAVTSSGGSGVLINLIGTSTIFCDLSASFVESLVSIATVAPIEGGPIGLTGTISLQPMLSGTLLGNGTGTTGAPGSVQIANGLALGEATGFLWNPALAGPNITLYNGQQSATIGGASNTDSVIASPMLSAGKVYFEITVANIGENILVGVAGAGDVTSAWIGTSTLSLGVLVAGSGLGSRGEVFYNNAGLVTWSSGGFNPGLTGTGVYGFAVDLTNELLWCTPDGVNWFGASSSSSGVNPATGAGGLSISSLLSATGGAIAPAATISTVLETTTTTVNGGTPWAYTPPSGFGGPTTPQLSFAPIAGASVIGNSGTASAAPVATPLTTMLDAMAVTYAQGDVLVRNSSGWVALAPGAVNQVLAMPSAATPSWAGVLSAYTSLTTLTGSTTLSAAQYAAPVLLCTGALTGNVTYIVPNNGEWTVVNATTGSYTVTVKTSAGTGVTVDQGLAALLVANGTNVVRGNSSITKATLFTSSGTWTAQALSTAVRAIGAAGGGGGGGGALTASGTAASGGAGGGGGGLFDLTFRISDIGTTQTITVGAGGTAGAASTTNSTAGSTGGGGGPTAFGGTAPGASLVSAGGGGGGAGGQIGGASGGGGGGGPNAAASNGSGGTGGGGAVGFGTAGGSGASASSTSVIGYGGGGGGCSVAGVAGGGSADVTAPSGGGAGGGITTAPASNNGGAGGGVVASRGTGGNTGGTGGTSGTPGGGSVTPAEPTLPGYGGGGGYGNSAGAAGAGGAGTQGGGGGGGGSALNGSTAGAGGAGGAGWVVVLEW